MFPLNSVVYPGLPVPLRVFEDRYRALVAYLLREPDPTRRLFGTVAIREGYEVGERGRQSLYRVGCLLQLTDVEQHRDGTYSIEAVGRDRLRLHELDSSGDHPVGLVDVLGDHEGPVEVVPPEVEDAARRTFERYCGALASVGLEAYDGRLPRDPGYLSWTLASCAPLPLHDRQKLLEADGVASRLQLVTSLLRSELRAMQALPSLPASEIARTRWSPN